MISANRGEWSELYALGYLLVNGGGFSADEFAKVDKSIFYKVLEVVDNPTGGSETVYKLEGSEVSITQNGVGVVRIRKDEIAPSLRAFFEELVVQSGSRSFPLGTGDALLKILLKSRLAASSALTQDLHLVLEDLETKIPTPRRGFSIKSEIGSPATVFNASHSTNLTFRIKGEGEVSEFANVSGVKSNLKGLISQNFSLEFVEYDNPKLQTSLENIDSSLPVFLAELMLAYYQSKTTNLRVVCDSIWPDDQPDSALKVSKIKKFLSATSMGLRANQVWSGYPQDFGGLLLVKKDGDVLFYYLYNLQRFEDYLFKHLRFETPSATKHGFGQIYFTNGEPRIKLNLQMRF